MKIYKIVTILTVFTVILTSFTNCKCSEKAMNNEAPNTKEEVKQVTVTNQTEETQIPQGRGKEMPLFIRETYFQRNGSEINIYFPTLINKSNYKLEKVYFRGMVGDMQSGKASHFASLEPYKNDLKMSNEENAEYGNTSPGKFPFEIKANECMIRYIDKGETKYFQVYNIIEKR